MAINIPKSKMDKIMVCHGRGIRTGTGSLIGIIPPPDCLKLGSCSVMDTTSMNMVSAVTSYANELSIFRMVIAIPGMTTFPVSQNTIS